MVSKDKLNRLSSLMSKEVIFKKKYSAILKRYDYCRFFKTVFNDLFNKIHALRHFPKTCKKLKITTLKTF